MRVKRGILGFRPGLLSAWSESGGGGMLLVLLGFVIGGNDAKFL